MAMNGPSWGSEIANDLLNRNVNSVKLSSEERATVVAIWQLICSDNVGNIVNLAQVTASGIDSNGDTVTVTGEVIA